MNNSPAKPTEGAQGSANSKTPRTSRTDSLIAKFKYDDLQGANCCMAILAEHANQLEQELLSAHGRGYGDDAFIQIQAEKITELERQLAQSEERAAELEGALRDCADDRKELLSGVVQSLSMLGDHYDEFCDEDVPEMTNGSPLHQSLTMLRGHLEGTLIGRDGEYMPRDKFSALLSSSKTN